jgi:predicted DNA binding CopG/RHH family protein/uncharacterized DUF497 family protein
MQFDWDSGNIDHIALHDVLPQEAEQVVENDPFDVGAILRNGETRTLHLGETDSGRVLLVVVPNALECTESSPRGQPTGKNERSTRTIRQHTMTKTLQTPEFKSEAEEAAWWDDHPDETLALFEQAAQDGTLGRGTLVRRAQTAATSIRLDVADIELAKTLAEKRGLRYQTYLKMIIHQQLLKEASSV